MTAVPEPPAPGAWRPRDTVFVLLMVVLTGLFGWLGYWQLERLDEKQALIDTVASRMTAAPVELPPAAEWPATDWEAYDFRPLTVTGSLRPADTVLVFTSLGAARGEYSGPGYWVMTPLVLTAGGTVYVNRGFIPQESGAAFAAGGTAPAGAITLTGIGRLSEMAGSFTPDADIARRIEWVRDVERLALFADPALAPFAPLYVDASAGETGALPQGGETRVEFPNNHLGYAITWFGFALLTPILLAVWLAARRRPRKVP